MKNGTLLIDKPEGWTSFDVVAKIRSGIRQSYRKKGERPTKNQLKVGHAGTLDPFATGLLIILLGDECKNAQHYLKLDKRYEFSAKLGEVSTTGDPEGDISVYRKKMSDVSDRNGIVVVSEAEEPVGVTGPDDKEVKNVLRKFVGDIEQTPPAYSAIKIDGKRAYTLAREGKAVEIPSRKVTISQLELLEYEYPYLKCRCDVSSGTYIRTLVEDIGKMLGTGAYCSQLRRSRVGDWHIEDAQTLETVLKTLDRK